MAVRILVVDETAFVRDSLKQALRRFLSDVEVFDAVNGSRALPILRTNKIDLILSEWELAEMSGQELLQWVRGDDTYKTMPFIVVSSAGDKNMVMQAIQEGASDFMAKPFSPDELQKKVVKHLARVGCLPRQLINQAAGSLENLMSGVKKPTKLQPRKIESAESYFNKKPTSASVLTGGDKKTGFTGTALLTLGETRYKCDIHDISLTGVALITERPEPMINVFDLGRIEIADDKTNILGNLKVYIHMVQAHDPRPDAAKINVMARFVDNTPEAMEGVSKVIGKRR